jgi:hypothetical protein
VFDLSSPAKFRTPHHGDPCLSLFTACFIVCVLVFCACGGVCSGAVVLTGGDAEWLHACLQTRGAQGKHAGWGPGETDSAREGKEGPRWVVNNDVAHHGLHWVVRRLRGQGDG